MFELLIMRPSYYKIKIKIDMDFENTKKFLDFENTKIILACW